MIRQKISELRAWSEQTGKLSMAQVIEFEILARSIPAIECPPPEEQRGKVILFMPLLDAEDYGGKRMAQILTPRELEIVGCVADGMDDKAIGEYHGIALETVKRHLTNIRDKMGVDSRLEICVSVYRHPALLAAVTIPSRGIG